MPARPKSPYFGSDPSKCEERSACPGILNIEKPIVAPGLRSTRHTALVSQGERVVLQLGDPLPAHDLAQGSRKPAFRARYRFRWERPG